MQIHADGLRAAPILADREGAVLLARIAKPAGRVLAVVVTRRSGV
ncbi:MULTISPECIES: hypothetical protein [Nocardia]|nr:MULTISPECIES: hypothetical protein [Nocardia]